MHHSGGAARDSKDLRCTARTAVLFSLQWVISSASLNTRQPMVKHIGALLLVQVLLPPMAGVHDTLLLPLRFVMEHWAGFNSYVVQSTMYAPFSTPCSVGGLLSSWLGQKTPTEKR